MRRRRTYANRKWRILRNLLASALALWLVWVLSGTPALTYEMLLRETARENLVGDVTVLYDEPWLRDGQEKRRVAYLQNGDCFWTLRYTAWPYEGYTDLVGADGGVLVLPSREGPWMLAMGAPQEAASAELSWAILGADGTPVAQFQAQGVQAAPGVWRFTLPEGVTEWEQERQEALQQNSWPQDEFVYVLQVFNRDGALLSDHGCP
ncbi:hypothetical protein [Dysosmobacter sp.]|uniref:hypothetical protein n=1 Tax=Dysosmobacter sp. TaxID=2591382 RepID=UPI003FD7FD03